MTASETSSDLTTAGDGAPPVLEDGGPHHSRKGQSSRRRRLLVHGSQVLLAALFLAAWQYLPTIHALQEFSNVFDRFFVSSPTAVAEEVWRLMTGNDNTATVWSYLWATISASLLGTAIGMALGAAAGLVLSNFEFLSSVLKPFVIAANATPRVALIPVIILLFGISFSSSVVIAVLVVFFVAFFNAFEGGTTIPQELISNARLLGASPWKVLRVVRMPFVLAWTFAALPLAITFAIISVVTGEILTGYRGMGRLLANATNTVNSTLTFAVVVILGVVGLVTVLVADSVRNRVLHWWGR